VASLDNGLILKRALRINRQRSAAAAARSPDISRRPDRLARRLRDPALDPAIPVLHPVGPPPVRAQPPVAIQRRQHRRAVTQHRRLPQPNSMRDRHFSQMLCRVLVLDPFDVLATGAQDLDRQFGMCVSYRRRQLADRLPEPARRLQRGNPRVSARTASSRRAMIVSDTIDVSSTTITSCGNRLPRWRRNRD
jgi:hypothetical protein